MKLSEKDRNLLYLVHIASSWSGAILIGVSAVGFIYFGYSMNTSIAVMVYGFGAKFLGEWTGLVRARSSPFKVWEVCHVGGVIIWGIIFVASLIGVLVIGGNK